jgi:small subunit ribosomal protein S19
MGRSLKKSRHVVERLLEKVSKAENTGNREPIKTRARACTIVPEFVGKKFAIYNGKTFIKLYVTEDMVGHKLGEFVPVRIVRGHGGKATTASSRRPAPAARAEATAQPIAVPIPVAEALATTTHFTPAEFQVFVGEVLAMRARRVAPIATAAESDMLVRINEALPEDRARRLELLQAKRDTETLTNEEHQELIRLSDESEELVAKRLEALAELASIRGSTLVDTMRALALTPAGHG